MEAFKIATQSLEHSIAVQKALFELGYKWTVGVEDGLRTTVVNNCIQTSKNGTMFIPIKPFRNELPYLTLEQLQGMLLKRGDSVLVRDSEVQRWSPAIFLTKVGGAELPYCCVSGGHEGRFAEGLNFRVMHWRLCKMPVVEEQKVVELTIDQIAEKFGVEPKNVKIIK